MEDPMAQATLFLLFVVLVLCGVFLLDRFSRRKKEK